MSRLYFNVNGTPGAQGSKINYGKGRMAESSKKVAPWRTDVKAAAQEALLDSEWDTTTPEIAALVLFRIRRPKSHYRTGRYAHLLRDDAPTFVTSRGVGDLDKLLRSTFDALTAAGVIGDDSWIVRVESEKRYSGGTPGADIELTRIEAAS